jgi:hypothetical protein
MAAPRRRIFIFDKSKGMGLDISTDTEYPSNQRF